MEKQNEYIEIKEKRESLMDTILYQKSVFRILWKDIEKRKDPKMIEVQDRYKKNIDTLNPERQNLQRMIEKYWRDKFYRPKKETQVYDPRNFMSK